MCEQFVFAYGNSRYPNDDYKVRHRARSELRTFLDETVRHANRLAMDARAREQQEEQDRAASTVQQEAERSAAAQAVAERDAQLTDTFRRSG